MKSLTRLRSTYWMRQLFIKLNVNTPQKAGEMLYAICFEYKDDSIVQHFLARDESASLPKKMENIWYGCQPGTIDIDDISYIAALHLNSIHAEESLLDAYYHGPDNFWDSFIIPSSLEDPGLYSRDQLQCPPPRVKTNSNADTLTRLDEALNSNIIPIHKQDNRPLADATRGFIAAIATMVGYYQAEENRRNARRFINPLLQDKEINEKIDQIGDLAGDEAESLSIAAIHQLEREIAKYDTWYGVKQSELRQAIWAEAWRLMNRGFPQTYVKNVIEDLELLTNFHGMPKHYINFINKVSSHSKRHGNQKIEDADKEEIKHLKSIGMSVETIASKFGISKRTVYNYCR